MRYNHGRPFVTSWCSTGRLTARNLVRARTWRWHVSSSTFLDGLPTLLPEIAPAAARVEDETHSIQDTKAVDNSPTVIKHHSTTEIEGTVSASHSRHKDILYFVLFTIVLIKLQTFQSRIATNVVTSSEKREKRLTMSYLCAIGTQVGIPSNFHSEILRHCYRHHLVVHRSYFQTVDAPIDLRETSQISS